MHERYLERAHWSDAELIAAVPSFDAAAFAELYERHAAAARTLAAQLSADPADVEAIVADTFAQLHDVLQDAAGPKVALRPYLFTALRWVAHDHLGGRGGGTAAGTADPIAGAAEPMGDTSAPRTGQAAAATPEAGSGQAGKPGAGPKTGADAKPGASAKPGAAGSAQQQGRHLGEPLLTDPAIASLARSPLYRGFRLLPERFQAVLWHAKIERTEAGQTAKILGLSPEDVEDLASQARQVLREACLSQCLADVTREDCRAALTVAGTGSDGPLSGPAKVTAQHLGACPDCRSAVTELSDLSGSWRRVLGSVFLGAAAAAYLASGQVSAVIASPGVGGPQWPAQEPSRPWQRMRQNRVLIAGGAALGVLALTGLALAAVSGTGGRNTLPSPRSHAAAVAPATPPPASPFPVLSPSSAGPTPASQATPAASAAPQPTAPGTTAPAPTPPAPASPRPTPCPLQLPHHHHHCPPPPPPRQ
jgi:DNA-directed RNA polymerase specialized sigma24 family protein